MDVEGRHKASRAVPVQTLTATEALRLGALNPADAMRFTAGVQVKDYGGLGGLKTVDVRAMGSHHVAVTLDGMTLGNAQNGQIDLGQYSLHTLGSVSLTNGQQESMLQPASVTGYGSVLSLNTARPDLSSRPWHIKASLTAGSAMSFIPSVTAQMRVSPKVSASVSAHLATSDGRYKFRYRAEGYDTTAVREGGDMLCGSVEANLFGEKWTAKAYFYGSDRGLPGAIVSNVWHRDERLADRNCLVQGSYTDSSGRWSHTSRVKAAYYHTRYDNRDQPSLGSNNIYRQTEVFASTAHQYRLLDSWRVAAAADVSWHSLQSNVPGFVRPDRLGVYCSASTRWSWRWISVQGSLLYNGITDWRQAISGHVTKHVWSPSVMFRLGQWRGWSVRTFAKRSFRMPTFNDLYYTNVGSVSLRPESAMQFNLGLSYSLPGHLDVTLDGYHNIVSDKIVAIPRGQQFRWTMLNLGRVNITGADLTLLYMQPLSRQWQIVLRGQYSIRRAVDVTRQGSGVYGHQIPYTPLHSASGVLTLKWKDLTLDYTVSYTGERYSLQQNIPANRLAPFTVQDLALTYARPRWSLQMRVDNLAAAAYEVIANYPMPLRTVRLTATYNI